MKGLVLQFCIRASLPHAPTLPRQAVASETSTSVLLPFASIFFFSASYAPLGFPNWFRHYLGGSLACLLACLVCLHSVLPQLWAFSRVTKRRERGGKKILPTQKPLFHYANNMLCSLHRIHPIFADLLILRWDRMTPWLHWQMGFSFRTRFYVTPGFTFL